MIQDGNGLLVPQYFNPDDDVFEVIQGKDGQPIGGAAEWVVSADSAANDVGLAAKAGVAGSRHYVTMIEAVVSGAAVGQTPIAITLSDDVTVVFKRILKAAAAIGDVITVQFGKPIAITVAKAANLGSEAAGAGSIITLNMAGYTVKTSV